MGELLVVENEESGTLGALARGFTAAGLSWRVLRPHAGDEIPATPAGAAGLVILGGAPHVYDASSAPWMADVMRLVRQAHSSRVPTLGICLGAQIVAQALGGSVRRGPAPETGFTPVKLTDVAKGDPVVGHLDGARVFQLHEDTYERPPGATLLASSSAYEEQAFRVGATTYGVQFHPEATADHVARMLTEEEDADALVHEAKALGGELDRVADGVASGFARLVRQKLRL